MKIEAGKYYELTSGVIAKSIQKEGYWVIGGYTVKPNGTGLYGGEEYVLGEVTVTDVLPFPLEDGKQYNTTKPDGTPGPVVKLQVSRDGDYYRSILPFRTFVRNMIYGVSKSGMVCSRSDLGSIQITSPYVEPKPPTIAERLENWLRLGVGDLEAIVADAKKLEATK